MSMKTSRALESAIKSRTTTNFAWYLDGITIAPGHHSFTIGQMKFMAIMHALKDARKTQMPEMSNCLTVRFSLQVVFI